MVAIPGATPVTRPLFTEAILLSVVNQSTFTLVASVGLISAFRVTVSPTLRLTLVALMLTLVTAMGAMTLTVHLATNPPSLVLTLITVEPAVTAVTLPVLLTVATDGLSEDHVTDLSVAPSGVITGSRVSL